MTDPTLGDALEPDPFARVINTELDRDPASLSVLSALVAGTSVHISGDVMADHGGVAIAGNNRGPITINPPPPRRWTPHDGPKRVGPFPPKPTVWIDRPEQADITAAFANGSQIVVIHGGRGYGKTSLAAGYAASPAAPTDLTVWVNALTIDHVITDLASAARTLGWATYPDSEHTATATRDELSSLTTNTLLVFDNAENPSELIPWIPGGRCQILITTIHHAFAQHGAPVPITTYTRDQATTYLEESTGLNDIDGANHVAETLGDHPLALALAAAVTTARRWTYVSYLDMHSAEDLSVSLPQGTLANYPDGYVNALALSIRAVTDADPRTNTVLTLLAVLDTPISRHLITELLQRVGNALSPTTTDTALATLSTTSLITLNPTHVTVHRLIPRALRDTLASEPNAYQQALTATAHALTETTISNSRANIPLELADEIGRHATTLLTHAAPNTANLGGIAAQFLTIGELLFRAGAFRAVATLTETTTTILQDRDETHIDVINSRNLLGTALTTLGHHTEAIRLHEINLAVASESHPSRYDILLLIQTNLALSYHAADRPQEALALYQVTLDTARRVRPDDYRLHDQIMTNMAGTYLSVGRPDLALPLFISIHSSREQHLGARALDTVRARSNLASTYLELGDYEEALVEFRSVLPRWEDLLSTNHPDVLLTRINVARCQLEMGNVDAALPLLEGAVEQLQAQLPDHENTRQAIALHAMAYQLAQRFQEAIPLWENAIRIMQLTLPHDHLEITNAQVNLQIARRQADQDP